MSCPSETCDHAEANSEAAIEALELENQRLRLENQSLRHEMIGLRINTLENKLEAAEAKKANLALDVEIDLLKRKMEENRSLAFKAYQATKDAIELGRQRRANKEEKAPIPLIPARVFNLVVRLKNRL
ncbi:hypothetical protein F66182_8121 [Fusarium sp. NRRL 66182]|nr:hypothetical protein F66182_8121 [Fusarium sp. NRRL 66182]